MSIDSPEKAWQELYRAALFETDKTKAAERMAHAERVIEARARSLFNNADKSLAERDALDAAFYALGVSRFYIGAQQSHAKAAKPAPRSNAGVAKGTNERTRRTDAYRNGRSAPPAP